MAIYSWLHTICPETTTELICLNFWDVKITLPRQRWIKCPRGPNSPEITVRKSFKYPVRITASKNNSKTISEIIIIIVIITLRRPNLMV